jgi:hypothetical protein
MKTSARRSRVAHLRQPQEPQEQRQRRQRRLQPSLHNPSQPHDAVPEMVLAHNAHNREEFPHLLARMDDFAGGGDSGEGELQGEPASMRGCSLQSGCCRGASTGRPPGCAGAAL